MRTVAPALAFAVLAPIAALAAEDDGEGIRGTSTVDCQVHGYDLFIFNTGDETLPAGTPVSHYVPFSRASGVHILESDLDPAQVILLSGAAGEAYLGTRIPCEVWIESGPREQASEDEVVQ